MNQLWSFSTTIRNPERIPGFLKTLSLLEGKRWEESTQKKFQILLIKNRLYLPSDKNLTQRQISILKNPNYDLSYQEAAEIFISKEYESPAMRGRTSFDPIEKMGFVNVISGKIRISELGKQFIAGGIDFGEVVFKTLLKQQLPNPLTRGLENYSTKPFINTLRIIKKVNQKCLDNHEKATGITREEFGIFVLSLKHYRQIQEVVEKLYDFRKRKEKISDFRNKTQFVKEFIASYLHDFQNPHKNIQEYSDNMIRILRLTGFIYVRGNGYYIDLEPRKKIEINALLDNDDGSAKLFSKSDWIQYMSALDSYGLPWEQIPRLKEIYQLIHTEISNLQSELSTKIAVPIAPDDDALNITKAIFRLKEIRKELLDTKDKRTYQEIHAIDQTITNLINIRQLPERASIELERLGVEVLSIINDSKNIKPNYPIGDDNMPTFTAPAGVPDIECEYDSFDSICEVTMLTGKNQWYNEGQPVMRHLKSFMSGRTKPTYCLFIAPRLHPDTINTFWYAVKHEYEGVNMKILPITIDQIILIIKKAKNKREHGTPLHHKELETLFTQCTKVDYLNNSFEWKDQINRCIDEWTEII